MLRSFSETISTGNIETFQSRHDIQIKRARQNTLREYIRKNPDMDSWDIAQEFQKKHGFTDFSFSKIRSWADEILAKLGTKKAREKEERKAKEAPKIVKTITPYIRTKLDDYLKNEKTIYRIQAEEGVRLDLEGKEIYNKDRRKHILASLNRYISESLGLDEIPSINKLKGELLRGIKTVDAEFRLNNPMEGYKVGEKARKEQEKRRREVEREERREKTEKEKKLKKLKEVQLYRIDQLLQADMTPAEIAKKLWIDHRWDETEMLFLAKRALAKMPEEKRRKAKEKKKTAKERTDLEKRTGLEDVEGLSEKNIIPQGEYYHPLKGWY